MKLKIFFIISFSICFLQCARIGSPTGGDKDETAPKVISTYPNENSTNFNKKRIELIFDEFVTIKNPQKQLIISPPLKYFPEISPLSNASKKISIRFTDTLLTNTTYTVNFGNSIQDYNENNTLPFYKYVFSTGKHIDSLSVKGTIYDAINQKTDNFVSVMLYPYDQKYSDSIVYKTHPIYITNTLDSLQTFEITNVKEGKYRLVALKDKLNNYLFDPKDDKIGFYKEIITIPSDSIYDLYLFKETQDSKVYRPFQSGEKRISLGYQGNRDSLKINILTHKINDLKYFISKEKNKDTLNFWFSQKVDSLKLLVYNSKIDTFNINLRNIKADSLQITTETKTISPELENLIFVSNIPITKINKDFISVIKDSVPVPFNISTDKDSLNITLNINTEANNQYEVRILPKAFIDFYNNTNDTITTKFTSKSAEDFATFKLHIEKKIKFPIIIELTNEQGDKLLYQNYFETEQKQYSFDFIKPGQYNVRIIEDTNGNKKWDTGNFLKKLLPEKVYHLNKKIELRANWEVIEKFIENK